VAFAGCVLIGVTSRGSASGAGFGIPVLLVAVCAYAAAVVIQKPVLARASPLQVTSLGCAAATIACLPFAPGLVGEIGEAETSTIGWVVYLGVVSTSPSFATWTYALRRMNAGRLAALAYLVPVVATLLAWAILKETPPRLATVGGALCIAGVALARRR
jgi:drug/metabolite transporter (DMT)-like permease